MLGAEGARGSLKWDGDKESKGEAWSIKGGFRVFRHPPDVTASASALDSVLVKGVHHAYISLFVEKSVGLFRLELHINVFYSSRSSEWSRNRVKRLGLRHDRSWS